MMIRSPCTDIIGHGTHNQPAGTWSDDTSMTLCLAETLSEKDFDLDHLGRLFVDWFDNGYWTAHGICFDYGGTTAQAIQRLKKGVPVEASGSYDESSNGNGSLMRILPLVFFTKDFPIVDRFEWTRRVSAITHGYVRSVIACINYLEYARLILQGIGMEDAYRHLQRDLPPFLSGIGIDRAEIEIFNRLLFGDIATRHDDEIRSDGYVVHTLEASIWCLLSTDTYMDAVLEAVNLGGDSDSTGTVVGGLSGLIYGVEGIQKEWLEVLARRDDIEDLAKKMTGGLDP